MSDRRRIPPTPDRSPGRRPGSWFSVLLVLAALLLALSAYGIARAQTETDTQSIASGGFAELADVTIWNRSANECEFTVTKASEPPGGGLPGLGEVPVQWDITSSGCTDLLVDLDFHYTQQELANGNGVSESRLRVFRHTGSGLWDDQCGSPCVDEGEMTVGVTDVDSLSDWTIGDLGEGNGYPTYPGPTAVSIRGPAQGERFDESGLVLGLSVLAGIGLILGWRLRRPAT